MNNYATVYAGPYNVGTQQFTPSFSPPSSYSYSVGDGVFEAGDDIDVIEYLDDAENRTIEGEFVGYNINGFLISYVDGGTTNYLFVTNNTGIPTGTPFTITTDTAYAICFLAGTLIATPTGKVPVETLKSGDLVTTASGETSRVRWIGRQSVMRMFANPLRSYPVCIRASALDDNVPERDLYVSPDHALLVDGLLVQANALLNGTTITRVERPEECFTYFHIELEGHALVLAEGAPAETFVDNVTRRRFDNYAEFEALYGVSSIGILELDVPRVKSARQLPLCIARRLATRAGEKVAVA